MKRSRDNGPDPTIEDQAWTWLCQRFGWFDRRAASPCREAQLAVWNNNPKAPWRHALGVGATP